MTTGGKVRNERGRANESEAQMMAELMCWTLLGRLFESHELVSETASALMLEYRRRWLVALSEMRLVIIVTPESEHAAA